MAKLFSLLAFFISSTALAYPDFISYGYNTCISCHYNSHGNGPLTDYGRALFSQEIAARNFWTKKSKTDEEIAEKSQFIPGVDLPYWIRPSIKYRGIYAEANPGSSNSRERWIKMQRDLNLVFATDDSARMIFVLNYGFTHEKQYDYYQSGEPVNAVTREHYFRFFPVKKLLIAAGLMDVAYGLRTSDHTSVSRDFRGMGLGQDDQVHGVMAQWFEEKWDATIHAYLGNMFEPDERQRQGASFIGEYLTSETNKLGFSIMQANSDQSKSRRVAIHNRLGIPNVHGSSILAELGLRDDQNIVLGTAKTQGMYAMVQSIVRLTRGYNLQSSIERYQIELKSTGDEVSKWTLGFLMFPLQRTEVRLNMVQTKFYSPVSAISDSTQLQGQVHVSW